MTNAISTKRENLLPSAEWTQEQIADYVKERLGFAQFFGRKTAVQLWLAGRALQPLQALLKAERGWMKWLDDNGIPSSTAHNCLVIADKFPTLDLIEGLTLVEAKQVAGIVKPKQVAAAVPATDAPTPAPDTESEGVEEAPAETTTAPEPAPAPAPTAPAPTTVKKRDVASLASHIVQLTDELDQVDPDSVPIELVERLISKLQAVAAHVRR